MPYLSLIGTTVLYLGIIQGIIYLYFRYAFTYWRRHGIAQLKPRYPRGDLLLDGSIPLPQDIARLYTHAKKNNLKYAGFYASLSPALLLTDLKLIRQIMVRDAHIFDARGIPYAEHTDPLTANLFSLSGARWRHLRTRVNPAFTAARIRALYAPMRDCAAAPLLRDLYMCAEGGDDGERVAWNAREACAQHVISVFCRCAYGFETTDRKFRDYGAELFQPSPVKQIVVAMLMYVPWLVRALGVTYLERHATEFYTELFTEAAKQRGDEKTHAVRHDLLQFLIDLSTKTNVSCSNNSYKTNNDSSTNDNSNENPEITGSFNDNSTTNSSKNNSSPRDISGGISLQELVSTCYILLQAGFESSATLMTFALYELALNETIQTKVRQEIIETLQRKYGTQVQNGELTYECLMEMRYLHKVVAETLRKYPPLPMTLRSPNSDYCMPNYDSNVNSDSNDKEKIRLCKGAKVVIPIYAIHHDSEYYADPERFDPDRFDDGSVEKSHAYMPFGIGPRICIGMRFGQMQSKLGLASILMNFKLTLNERTKVPLPLHTASITLVPSGDVWLNVEKL